MKLARFLYEGRSYDGYVDGETIICRMPGKREQTVKLENVRLLPPVRPSKIICVGLNYKDHAVELGMALPTEPIIFIKPPSAMIGPMDNIVCPPNSGRVDFEGELAVVIKKKTRNADPARAKDCIMGYTCFNDVTARDIQEKDGQWTRAKGFDTFAPLGPWVETDIDAGDLAIKTFLNGRVKQCSSTSELIFGVPELVSFISGVMTLFPGDVIATGTPGGIGPMYEGDEVVVEIEGIGRLVNSVTKK
jgi:2-keto-4-pentenoate hydratase/2-oxohepta-3-ene-1,7-dioic acid hydratase in catechol pathway